MISLERFNQTIEVVIPIVNNHGQYKQRKMKFHNLEDGYYDVWLSDIPRINRKASQYKIFRTFTQWVREGQAKKFTVYPLGTKGIASDFNAFSSSGLENTVDVYFMNVPLFEVVSVVLYEDGKFYFSDVNYSSTKSPIKKAGEAFNENKSLIGIKGITPEIRYYFLLASLKRQAVRNTKELLEQWKLTPKEMEYWFEQLKDKFADTVKHIVEQSGGSFISLSPYGKGYMVEWLLGDQTVKTVMDDKFSILSAGFCLSGEDKKHSLTSVIKLAESYQEESPLYIIRD